MTDTYAHGESIYNIIPPREMQQQRLPMHRSLHDPRLAPTGTTFGGAQTSHPVAMNMSGNTSGKIVPSKSSRTFGKPKGSYSNLPETYMKKCSSTGQIQSLSQLKRSNPNLLRPSELKAKLKPDVPRTSDIPVMNLVTSKNFVVANAVETILAAPKAVTSQAKNYLSKEDYGRVPKYLKNIKQDINAEYEYIAMLQAQEDEENASAMQPMQEEQRLQLLQGLKMKWESVNTEYQGSTHTLPSGAGGAKYRKEKWEAELSQIEKDIEKINSKNIMVARDM